MDTQDLFIIFFVFSVLGYIGEIFYLIIYSKVRNIKYSHPSFFKIPFSAPYGFGVVVCIWFVESYPNNNIFISAIFCALAFSFIEYISAVFCENILNKKYWDYSDIKFNFQGRVCLLNLFLFVVFGLFFIQYLYTPTIQTISGLSGYNKDILAATFAITLAGYTIYSEDTKGLKRKIRKKISG